MANFFYENGELFLSKWRISFNDNSQNGEFFAVVMKCLKGLTQKSRLFAEIQNSRLLHSKKIYFLDLLQFLSRAKSEWF